MQIQMQSKQCQKNHQKALKEKDELYQKARAQMKSGNEEGARMYLELVQQKEQEAKQQQQMAVRLEAMSCNIKGKQHTVGMVNELNNVTGVLNQQNAEMNIEKMYNQLGNFNTAYDDMQVKGVILDQNMEKQMAAHGGLTDVQKMMMQAKAEVAQEMGVTQNVDPMANMNANAQTNTNNANKDFYAKLGQM